MAPSPIEPVWLDDSDLIDDDPPPPWRAFDVVPGALANALEDFYAPHHEAFSATIPPPPRRSAAVPAMGIAAAILLTFAGGWWVGQDHPPPGPPAVAHAARASAHSVRVQSAPFILTPATARRAPIVPIWKPPPPEPPVIVPQDKPPQAVAQVFVPNEL